MPPRVPAGQRKAQQNAAGKGYDPLALHHRSVPPMVLDRTRTANLTGLQCSCRSVKTAGQMPVLRYIAINYFYFSLLGVVKKEQSPGAESDVDQNACTLLFPAAELFSVFS